MWKKLDGCFRSLRWTTITILVIAGFSLIGACLPQGKTNQEYAELLGPGPARIVGLLGLDHLFQTGWYLALLAWLVFILAYCSLHRIGFLLTKAWAPPSSSPPPNAPLFFSRRFSLAARRRVMDSISRILGGKGYRVTELSRGSAAPGLGAEKGRLGPFGAPLIHLGLVIVLAGGLVTSGYRVVREITIGERETVALPGSETELRLDKFSIILYPGSREPEEYVSRLTVLPPGRPPLGHSLKVNAPLNLEGFSLFQMRYHYQIRSVALTLFARDSDSAIVVPEVAPGERILVREADLELAVEEIVPDFVIDPQGEVRSRTPFFQNPAVKVAVYSSPGADTPSQSVWVFRDFFASPHGGDQQWRLALERIKVQYFSGIKAVKDPGVAVAYLGFGFLVVGTCLSSYLFRRRLWVQVEPVPGEELMEIKVFGSCDKNVMGFEREMETIKKRITELGPGEP